MAQPYVGEIRMFGGNFAPAGWLFCEGQDVSIAEYDTLYQLIGTTYGGDGSMVFALPDLRGRVPIHQGDGFPLAAVGGVEDVTLSVTQIPAHSHSFLVETVPGDQVSPAGNMPAESFNVVPYINEATNGTFNPDAISSTGRSQPHSNFQPYVCVNFIIATFGIFPSPT